jgi:hypothetical protein
MRLSLVGLLFLAAFSSFGSAVGDPDKTAPDKDVVSAMAVWQDYRVNVPGADKQWKGKTVKISGDFHSVKKAKDGRYFVGLYIVDPKKYAPNIVCFIDETARKDFAQLKVGQSIKMSGKVVGRQDVGRKESPSPVYLGYIVKLEDCRFIGAASEP